jgi:taurine dioxygenase
MELEIIPLQGPFGAEVRGLDLSRPIAGEVADGLRRAWARHKVLLFREQSIDVEAQRRAVSVFGTIQAPRSRTGERSNPDIMYVANVVVDGQLGDLPDGDMQFHADQCYYETVAAGALLYAIEVPSAGGDTMFANAALAYAALPDTLKRRLEGLHVRFAYDYRANAYHRPEAPLANVPVAEHPAVITHPATGEPVLFVNRLMADCLVGLERAESEELLLQLFDHMERPDFIYRHVWRKGDVVLWDNLATVHARTDFDPAERRQLRRIAIAGIRPSAYRPAALAS